MSWKQVLDFWAAKHFTFDGRKLLDQNVTMLDYAYNDLQRLYPGNYIVEEYYNVKAMKFDFRLKFENEQEEILWRIKWS